jgi:FkbM family methyltransferase
MLKNTKKKVILLLVLLLVLLIILLIILTTFFSSRFTEVNQQEILKKFKYHDENGKLINHLELEIDEQLDALTYLTSDDVVLELGGRYGSVSVTIAHIQNNNGNLVVIEPDTKIINALIKNKENNNANFTVVNKYISNKPKKMIDDSYGTRMVNSEAENDSTNMITYDDFKKKYPLKFNVLVADCESCLCDFINDMGDDINNYNKILIEADFKELCEYDKLINFLVSKGFKIVNNNNNFRYVLIKN